MTILGECPSCHRKQSIKNKVCKCGVSLDEARKSQKIRHWISIRFSGGKQYRKLIGSLEDAKKARADLLSERDKLKRKILKHEKWRRVKVWGVPFPYDVSNMGRVRHRKKPNHFSRSQKQSRLFGDRDVWSTFFSSQIGAWGFCWAVS